MKGRTAIWRGPGTFRALPHCIQANSMKKSTWKLRLRHEVVYARTCSQQMEVLNAEPPSQPLSSIIAFLCLTLYDFYVSGRKPLISLRSFINKRHFLKKNKKSWLWVAFFWFLLHHPFFFLHPCVLPSGRLGLIERSVSEDGDLQTILPGA